MFTYLFTHSPLIYLVQPFWRDEAYAVLFAEHPLSWIVTHSLPESPLYYILLHIWMRIFGQGEIAVRSLSFVGFVMATVVVVYLSEYLFKKHWVSWFVPILFFTNPMLLYYAVEARAYGWYMFFAILAIYSYIKKNWKLFGLAAFLGFYTHLYMILVPFVCTIHFFLTNPNILRTPKLWLKSAYIQTLLLLGLTISPLFISFLLIAKKFKTSWYYPVDFQLIKSVLGNMYTGFEGTPWYGWSRTAWLSLILLVLFGISYIPKKNKEYVSFFLSIVFLPLLTVIGISFIKPLFVNRYLIPVTMAEIFLLGYAILAFRSKIIRVAIALVFISFSIGILTWTPTQHLKTDYRTPMKEIASLMQPNDVIFADDPIHFFETLYYAKNRSHVYLYMPKGGEFPWYIGDSIVEPQQIVTQLPLYPMRAFVLSKDTTYKVLYTMPFSKTLKK